MNSCAWPLGNGETLNFTVYDSNQNWNKVAGLYIFSYLAQGQWYPLYVGQTDDFSSRFPNHERLNEAIKYGATHIHAIVVPQAAQRNGYEAMLVGHLQPPMNRQLR